MHQGTAILVDGFELEDHAKLPAVVVRSARFFTLRLTLLNAVRIALKNKDMREAAFWQGLQYPYLCPNF